MGYLAKTFDQFKEHADFLTVYIREAHPQDEWQMESNVTDGTCYLQPRSLEDRVAIANDFVKRFQYPIPLGVDAMADTAKAFYAAWPERLYIIEGGKIAYKGGIGPFHYHPEEVRAWLEKRFPEEENQGKPAAAGLPLHQLSGKAPPCPDQRQRPDQGRSPNAIPTPCAART